MSRLRRPEQLAVLLGIPFSHEQLESITAPLEPGVIVAGAGSGKTTVMAARVVWLVASGQVAPAEVLGLTFTNKAAAELAARVRSALRLAGHGAGGDDGDGDGEPTVSTYHAFAGRLLQDHGLRLGVEPRARLLADATRFQLASRVLRQASGPFPSLSKPLSMLVDDLVAFDGELSEHLVSTDDVRRHDRALLAAIAALDRPVKDVTKAAEAARKRLELADLVDAYRLAKHEAEAVDFGDQVALAAQLAEERPEVGVLERDCYRVVLLDEYQDTSVAQRRMLVGLFGAGHPVTSVGDPCQAIYGWRGASVANLDDFPAHFPTASGTPARRRSLTRNRRSDGRLLRLANTITADLRARHGVAALDPEPARVDAGEIDVALFDSYDEEVAWAAEQVVVSLDAGTPPDQVAVLVRARSDFAALSAALAARDVPVEVVGLGGLLAMPEVADVVATLAVLDDPTANAALVRVLTGPRWQIGPRDLALLGRRARSLVSAAHAAGVETSPDAGLERAVQGVDPSEAVSLVDALTRPGSAVAYSTAARERFALLAAELAALRRHLDEPLLDVLHRIVETTGLDVELSASPRAVAARRRETLAAFLDHAAAFVGLDGDASVTAFLAYLRAAQEWERGLDTTAPSTAASVKLMTAHKAKGLEWDVVVVPNLTAGVFPSSQGRQRWTTNGHVLPYDLRGDAASLPPAPAWTTQGLQAFNAACREQALLEERRLGYVAFTRARHRLVTSGHWWGPTQSRPRGPSAFLEEIRRHCTAGFGRVHEWAEPPPAGAANPLRERALGYRWPQPLDSADRAARRAAAAEVRAAMAAGAAADPFDGLTPAEEDLVRGWQRDAALLLAELQAARTEQVAVALPATLSTSQLQRLAGDPDGLARDLARPMPKPPAPAARRGTRFHAWVEARFGQRPLLDPDELPGASDAHLRDDDLARLQAAFLASEFAERRPHRVEEPFQLVVGGRVVRGRIDAVYATDAGWEVVDWKTGARPEADPLQLAVYRLAWAEITGVPLERVGAAFFFVRSGAVLRPRELPDRAALERLLGPAR